MWYFLYNLGLVLASPVIVLILLSKPRCRRGLRQRLGFGWPASSRSSPPVPASGVSRVPGQPEAGAEPVVWVHAVSLGEVTAVVPLIRELHARVPGVRVVVSTVTETGREAVEQRLTGMAEHVYAPLDFSWAVSRVVSSISPDVFVFVETELWPNLLAALGRRGIPAILVNGRISTKSFRGYRLLRPFWRQVLGHVRWLLMQSDRDVERVTALGASAERVRRTGNVKFDQPESVVELASTVTREMLGLRPEEELLVAGSTHPREEEDLLACYRELQRDFPGLVLLMAPRHIERAGDLVKTVRAGGCVVVRRSDRGPGRGSGEPSVTGPRVIVLDTRGELAEVYRHARVAFVGGTLVPIGGHNLLEPAQWGKPVFLGPHTDHCAEVAALLVGAGGAIQVRTGEQLAASMRDVLRDPEKLRDMGGRAREVVISNRGALQTNLEVIAEVLRGQHARGVMPLQPTASDTLTRWQQRPGLRTTFRALSYPYAGLVRLRSRLYDTGWWARRRLPRPVISVGNLTVGGTGKTPIVIHLTNWLLKRGKRVTVLSRGYRRHGQDRFLLVSDGRSVLAGPMEAGDEPFLIAQRCPGAVVAVGTDRYALGKWVLTHCETDCYVLDDGFQHLALARDVDLVLVDATDAEGLQALAPAGRLREPLSAVARATAVVITRVESAPDWAQQLAPLLAAMDARQPIVQVRFRAEQIVNPHRNVAFEPGHLVGTRSLAVSGIGNPRSFVSLLQRSGLAVVAQRAFPDHHMYTPQDATDLLQLAKRHGAEVVLTTEKDAAKLAPLLPGESRLLAVRLGVDIVAGREHLEELVLNVLGSRAATVCA